MCCISTSTSTPPCSGCVSGRCSGCRCPPSQLHRVGELLAQHPEVAYTAATTGSTNLLASVVCSTVSDLYDYITRRIAVLPAVTHLESAPVVRTVKNAVTLGDRYHGTGA
ncbi:Lrp/AsnC family transcriptional regulator [Actinoallomurus iriomotensis]|uniref:Lrp/AsnC family transcriptional regulator n=1 Tax=Actinoallomurus iriomotensis TaxID=478107 RepID=UPI003D7F36D6